MKRIQFLLAVSIICVVGFTHNIQADPIGSAFSYQGRLYDEGNPAEGLYDLRFKLFNDPDGSGTQIGSTFDIDDIELINGYFNTKLDFGSGIYGSQKLWIQTSIRPYTSTEEDDY